MNIFSKLSLTAVACLALAACQGGNSAYIGEGPIQLSPRAQNGFKHYSENNGMVFAITEDGQRSWHHYCSHLRCAHLNMVETLYRCEKAHGRPCKVYAIDEEIVWRFPEKKSIEETLLAAKSKILDTDWSDIVEDQPVTIKFEEGLKAGLSMTSDETGACKGTVEFKDTKNQSRYPGEWSLSCEKGQVASGNLTLTATQYGELQFIGGRGVDASVDKDPDQPAQ